MIALVHHHLRRGGVTRVIHQHARILRDAGEEVVLVSGEPAPDPLPDGIRLRLLPELAYSDRADPATVTRITESLRALAPDPLLHIHNHALGKNPALTAAVARLAADRIRLVLQIHDFAEDGRPANLQRLRNALPEPAHTLYPHAPHVTYALLQARDRDILLAAGLPPGRAVLLPNPVETPADLPPPHTPPRHILYLSRCIRRKNIGEFLLWASVHGRDLEFATSLTPENPAERPRFDAWAALARELNLPVRFGIGMAPDTAFRDVAATADACITTSVGEGFGMSFLEPFLMHRPLLGRDLPDITAGFKHDGLRLDGLYTTLPVPAELPGPDFWPRALRTVQTARRTLGLTDPVTLPDLQTAWIQDGHIDFGRLDEPAQTRILRSGFTPDLPIHPDPALIAHNRQHIQTAYSPASTLQRLRSLYANTRPDPIPALSWLPPDRIRDAFADLSRFRLLQS